MVDTYLCSAFPLSNTQNAFLSYCIFYYGYIMIFWISVNLLNPKFLIKVMIIFNFLSFLKKKTLSIIVSWLPCNILLKLAKILRDLVMPEINQLHLLGCSELITPWMMTDDTVSDLCGFCPSRLVITWHSSKRPVTLYLDTAYPCMSPLGGRL